MCWIGQNTSATQVKYRNIYNGVFQLILLLTYCTSCTPWWQVYFQYTELYHVMKMLYILRKQWYASFIHKVDNWCERRWRTVSGWKYFKAHLRLVSHASVVWHHALSYQHTMPVSLIFNVLIWHCMAEYVREWDNTGILIDRDSSTLIQQNCCSGNYCVVLHGWHYFRYMVRICLSWHYFNVMLLLLACIDGLSLLSAPWTVSVYRERKIFALLVARVVQKV